MISAHPQFGPVDARPSAGANTLAKLFLLYIYALLSAAYTHGYVRRAPAGPRRLALALPLIAFNLAVPLMLDHDEEPLLITPIGGIFSLAAFKLSGEGRAPLSTAAWSRLARARMGPAACPFMQPPVL